MHPATYRASDGALASSELRVLGREYVFRDAHREDGEAETEQPTARPRTLGSALLASRPGQLTDELTRVASLHTSGALTLTLIWRRSPSPPSTAAEASWPRCPGQFTTAMTTRTT